MDIRIFKELTLQEQSYRILLEFVAEVLTVCKNDDTGVTWGIQDKALEAGVELGMTEEELQEMLANA